MNLLHLETRRPPVSNTMRAPCPTTEGVEHERVPSRSGTCKQVLPYHRTCKEGCPRVGGAPGVVHRDVQRSRLHLSWSPNPPAGPSPIDLGQNCVVREG